MSSVVGGGTREGRIGVNHRYGRTAAATAKSGKAGELITRGSSAWECGA